MTRTDTELLAAVERSPDAASRHDRTGWISLFTPDGRVEDPVGSRPHIGHTQLGRFYDTFIGPRRIEFHRDVDLIDGYTVIRDLTLEIQMDDRVRMAVPAVLRYLLEDAGAELKIARLQAYWELPPMMMQFAKNGVAALPAGLGLSRALLANQGLGGAMGFLGGLRRPGSRQRNTLVQTLTALSVSDELAIRRLLGRAELNVHTDDLARRLRGASWGKLLAAGKSVTASVWAHDGRLVVIAEFDDSAAVARLRVFG